MQWHLNDTSTSASRSQNKVMQSDVLSNTPSDMALASALAAWDVPSTSAQGSHQAEILKVSTFGTACD